jgi:tetratricopeptide (TPR) repeat protein
MLTDPGDALKGSASLMAENWNTVRVFISSTFRDMHAERDHLVKVVFPELRERMATRRLHLVDIDLRWGITEQEAEQGMALDICLEEIERSRPFFIGILGERYGSLLGPLSEEAELDHPWLAEQAGRSLTALEITHAVLRDPELARRSFFYFRDPRFIATIPEGVRADFAAEDAQAASKLAALKHEIRASGRPLQEDYPCIWDAGAQRVGGLEVFGERVLEDLWQAVCAEYPEEAPEPDPLDVERGAHEAFAEERSRLYAGREEGTKRLSDYVMGNDGRPAVVTGEPGCGKSAFLAHWSRQHAAACPDDLLLSYFVGASASSTDYRRLLRTMCEELKRALSIDQEIPDDDEKLSGELAALLRAAIPGERRTVLVIDALDQLSPSGGAHGLGWLLDAVPQKTRLVVSTLEGDCLDALRRYRAEEIALPVLGEEEQRRVVTSVLAELRRKLDAPQLAALLSHPGVGSPLYLRVALEELRVHGRFEQLLPQIERLAPDVSGLFDQVLQRLEEDYGQAFTRQAFSLISSSRYGLSEAELLDLLRPDTGGQLPRATWARLSRGARAYLVERGELVGFFHRQLAEAVTSRYGDRREAHARLAAYFADAPLERKLDEHPYQLQQSEEWEALAAALSDIGLLASAGQRRRTYEWAGYWRSLEGRFEPNACYQAALDAQIEREGEDEAVARSATTVGNFLLDMGFYGSALPFAERSLSISERALGPDHVHLATSLNNLARLHQLQGDHEAALPLYERALRIDERSLGPDHPEVARILNNLGTLHQVQGDYAAARPLFERALDIRERFFGQEDLEVSQAINNLAALYQDQGELAQALPLFERALAIDERVLGADHPKVATGLNNLAGVCQEEGDYSRALPLYERALAILERALGPDHPTVAQGLNNLATLRQDQGDYVGALRLYERALAIRERAFGTEHPDVAQSLCNLAGIQEDRADYAAAKALYERALAIWETSLGSDHPYTAVAVSGLGALREAQGDYGGALPFYERALAIRERALGANNLAVAESLNGLAALHQAAGDYDGALPLYGRALAIREHALGPDHPDVATSLNNLATLYCAQGRNAEALPLFERALAVRERALGPDHPDVGQALNNLGLVCQYLGNEARALPLFERALAVRERAFGPDHPDVAQALNNLALVHHSQGDYDGALPLYERALAIWERALGPDHPEVARSLNNIAGLCHNQGDLTRALSLYERALAIRERALGLDHPEVEQSLGNLASLYDDMGDPIHALPLHERALGIREHNLGPDDPQLAMSLNNLAAAYCAGGGYARAFPLFERAALIAEAKLGPDHPDTKAFRRNLEACRHAGAVMR